VTRRTVRQGYATRNKTNGGITRVGGTSTVDAKVREVIKVAKELDTYVRNYFRGNAEKLAAWKHARRIEKAPVRNNNPLPPAPPAPAPVLPQS
jgi:hypothetical protein